MRRADLRPAPPLRSHRRRAARPAADRGLPGRRDRPGLGTRRGADGHRGSGRVQTPVEPLTERPGRRARGAADPHHAASARPFPSGRYASWARGARRARCRLRSTPRRNLPAPDSHRAAHGSKAPRSPAVPATSPAPVPSSPRIVHADALELLREGELKVEGRLIVASDATLYCTIRHKFRRVGLVYKPIAGERPALGFPPARSPAGRSRLRGVPGRPARTWSRRPCTATAHLPRHVPAVDQSEPGWTSSPCPGSQTIRCSRTWPSSTPSSTTRTGRSATCCRSTQNSFAESTTGCASREDQTWYSAVAVAGPRSSLNVVRR